MVEEEAGARTTAATTDAPSAGGAQKRFVPSKQLVRPRKRMMMAGAAWVQALETLNAR